MIPLLEVACRCHMGDNLFGVVAALPRMLFPPLFRLSMGFCTGY
jgi:hypothetical protein